MITRKSYHVKMPGECGNHVPKTAEEAELSAEDGFI